MSVRVLGAFFVTAIWSGVVEAAGACCFSNHGCLVMTEMDCNVIPSSHWAGEGTDCSDKNGDALPDACFPHVGQNVYWSYLLPDPPGDRFAIQRADLDGVNVETILFPYVDFGEQGPNLFATASHHTKLYWGNNSLDVVRRTSIDGTG
ncbi:MAG: hypothetical protein V1790_14100, partial [Planctomycetota bacterium]